MYGNGANEELVGKAISSRRDEVMLATKFGIKYDLASNNLLIDGSPERVKQSCDGSLQRLGVDYIDLLSN